MERITGYKLVSLSKMLFSVLQSTIFISSFLIQSVFRLST